MKPKRIQLNLTDETYEKLVKFAKDKELSLSSAAGMIVAEKLQLEE